MKHLTNPSQLQKLSNFYSMWPDAVIDADANGEDFVNVEVITTSAYKKEIAFSQLCDSGTDLIDIDTKLPAIEQTLADEEFIEVMDDKIRVCLKAEQVDDTLIDRAMILIGCLDSITVGNKVMLNDIAMNES